MNPRHKEVKKNRRGKGKEAEGLKEKRRSRSDEDVKKRKLFSVDNGKG